MNIELTKEEAAVALATMIAFANGAMSDEEAGIMRKYFLVDDADSLEEKLTAAGVSIPTGLPAAEDSVIGALKAAPRGYQIRTLAVGSCLAHSDDTVDEHEFAELERFGETFGISHALASEYASRFLAEIDPADPDAWYDLDEKKLLELTKEEAGIAVAVLVAFRDGQVSDEEAAIVRRYYHIESAQTLEEKFDAAGYAFPGGVGDARTEVMKNLIRTPHEWQIRCLAVCALLVEADGTTDAGEETAIIREIAKECNVALFEVAHYADDKLSEVMD